MTESGKPVKGEVIHFDDIYSKDDVDNLILDPSTNTMTACIGYDQDILGEYDIG